MKIDANYIRKYVIQHYFQPARERGESTVSVIAGEVERGLRKEGLVRGRVPQVCNVLHRPKLQEEGQARLIHWSGPDSGQGPRAVFNFSLDGDVRKLQPAASETAEERASRLVGKLRSLLSDVTDEIGARGGAKAYLRWVRSEEDSE